MAQDRSNPELERDRDPMDEDAVVGYEEGEEFEEADDSEEESEESDNDNF
jgi:hypothetical protein